MKILQIAGSGTIGSDNMGPVSNVLFNLSREFHSLGHHVTIADAKGEFPRNLMCDGLRLIEIRTGPRWKDARSFPRKRSFLIQALNRLRAMVKEWYNEYCFIRQIRAQTDLRQFDIIHVHERKPAFLLQYLFHIDCVYTSHTPNWINTCPVKNTTGLRRRIDQVSTYLQQKKLEIAVIKKSRLTIGLGPYLKREIPGARIVTIPNGTDAHRFYPKDKAQSRKKLNFSPDDFILIFIGRLAPIKGIDILLKSIQQIYPQTPKLKLVIMGSPSGSFNTTGASHYAGTLAEKSKQLPVTFTGFINNRSEMFQHYLSAADLFIFPSIFEPQGCVVLEALSMGIPVIASRTGGVPQMVSPRVGRLFEPGDYAGLAELIKTYYEHPERMEPMAMNCRAHVISHFSWKNAAVNYLKAFKEVCDHDG